MFNIGALVLARNEKRAKLEDRHKLGLKTAQGATVSGGDEQSFLEACGCAGDLRLTLRTKSGERDRFQFDKPFARIGRKPGSDILLKEWRVSHRHAYLQVIDGRVFVMDLDSRTGIQWSHNGKGSGWLEPKTWLKVGEHFVRARIQQPESFDVPSPLVAIPEEDDSFPEFKLNFLNGSSDDNSWRLNRKMAIIGRSPTCKVQLLDETVSSHHCCLVRTSQGVWLVDLFGRGGTHVNNEPVDHVLLADGDELLLGRLKMQVSYSGHKASTATALKPFDSGILPLASASVSQPPQTNLALQTNPPTAIAPPAGLELAGETGQVMYHLVHHLGTMQQQMLDQNHQNMMMMMQMFTTMHQDNLALVKNELHEINRLSTELSKLQQELVNVQADVYAPRPEEPKDKQSPSLARLEGPSSEDLPEQELPPESSQPPIDEPVSDDSEKVPEPQAEQSPIEKKKTARKTVPTNGSEHPRFESPEDLHDWLNDRMALIQQERQTLWQRVMSVLGKG